MVRPLDLPLFGPSETVTFDVQAPTSDTDRDVRLRLALYLDNHLLQSFLLTARVGQEQHLVASRVLGVSLEASRTARFSNLDELGPRALSIGVNHGPDGSHCLFVKGQGLEAALEVDGLGDLVRGLRQTLRDATFIDEKTQRFPHAVPSSPPKGFEKYVRELAEHGRTLWNNLKDWMIATGQQEDGYRILDQLGTSEGRIIQGVRFDSKLVVPWALVYDRTVRKPPLGAGSVGVCLGDAETCRCAYKKFNDRYCVNGFWGVRHQIEDVQGNGVATNAQLTIEPVSRGTPVLAAVGITDPETTSMLQTLERELAGTALPWNPRSGQSLVERIWDAQRPNVLIVVGHLRTDPIVEGPEEPHIVLAEDPYQWLSVRDIQDAEAVYDPLSDNPRPVVLLLACATAALDMTSMTTLTLALERAGAAAVVGTESPVWTGLVGDFAAQLTIDLWKGRTSLGEPVSMGEAVRRYRKRLLTAGNPLGFVFTVFGNADLRRPREQAAP